MTMRQATALTVAAAAAAAFGPVDAQAATLNYSLTFTFQSNTGAIDGTGSSGTGAFSIDSGDLAGTADITDPTKIHDFSATFINVPSVGTLSFDQSDLNAVLLKHTDQTITGLSFGTQNDGINPYLNAGIFSTTLLHFDANTSINYNTSETLVSAIPEPASLSLLAAGAAGLPLIRRRRAKRAGA